jgi:hypothetical protein
MVDYRCIDGEWQYAPIADRQLEIPLPDGGSSPIVQLAPDMPQKMLGVWSCQLAWTTGTLIKISLPGTANGSTGPKMDIYHAN